MLHWNFCSLGLLDNILFDFCNGVAPVDDLNFCRVWDSSIGFEDRKKIIKFFNLTLINGIESRYYLKLCYVIVDVFRKNNFFDVGFRNFKKAGFIY